MTGEGPTPDRHDVVVNATSLGRAPSDFVPFDARLTPYAGAPTPVSPTLGLPAMTRPASWSEAKAELGKKLFFDTRLSSNDKMSCSTCHEPERAFTDGQRFSTKVDGKVNTRNSPSLVNVGYQPLFYWDGRADTLEKNVGAAWKGHMGGDPEKSPAAIVKVEGYAKEFQAVFGRAPTFDDMVDALSSFVRTLQSGGSRYDRFTNGDKSALNADEQAGMTLFLGTCASCHAGALFTDHQFHNVGIGMDAETPDPGRHKVDEKAALGSFKTPSLRSVSLTAPYFHDGSAATLADVVAHYDKVLSLGLAVEQQRDLVEYLKSL